MEATTVSSKGQVTIPKEVRRRLGIRKGSKLEFAVVEEHIEMRLSRHPVPLTGNGFGMLKSGKPSVPADFDPTVLLRDEGRTK